MKLCHLDLKWIITEYANSDNKIDFCWIWNSLLINAFNANYLYLPIFWKCDFKKVHFVIIDAQ